MGFSSGFKGLKSIQYVAWRKKNVTINKIGLNMVKGKVGQTQH